MRISLLFAVLTVQFAILFAFNIDTQQPIVREGLNPSEQKLFGYSVESYSNAAGKWILVGAPRDDTDAMKRYGALYRCRITKDAKCEPFRNLPGVLMEYDSFDRKTKPSDRVYDQWLGVSVKAKTDGIIVSCAHRYINLFDFQAFDPVGRCLIFNTTFDLQPILAPCKDEVGGLYGFSYCQSGSDVAIADDGKTILVANPGTFNWQGNAEIVDSSKYTPSSGKYDRLTRTNRYSGAREFSYLAYSVGFGTFKFHGNTHEFAAGVPRYDEYIGKVVIFSYNVDTKLASVSASVSGFQVGAYFGHSVLVIDLNQDTYDDLVVGAPFYTGLLRDQGRVHTYINTQKSDFSVGRVLTGPLAKGRFGYAIAAAGDVNLDGFIDIAIGAPFSDNPTVYLYTTSPNGLVETPLQVISESSLNLNFNIPGFGAALAGGVDLDGNEYPDIVVGAFLAEKAVVLRSKPVASIDATLSLNPQFLNYSSSSTPEFTAELCMKFTGIVSEVEISINYNIEVDKGQLSPRAWFKGTNMLSTLSGSKLVSKAFNCTKFVLNLRPNIQNLNTPVIVDVTYSRPPEPQLPEGDGNPVVSPLSSVLRSDTPSALSQAAYLLSGCRQGFICIPDLRVVSAETTADSVTLGQDSSVGLTVYIENRDEGAYAAKMVVTFLKELRQERILLNGKAILCVNQTKGIFIAYSCDIGNPLQKGQRVKVEVFVLLGSVSVTTPNFNFTVEATSANPENQGTLDDNSRVSSPVSVVVQADFGIQGSSSPSQSPIDPTDLSAIIPTHTEQIGPEVTHSYFVQNRGPSPIPETIVTVSWPMKTSDNRYLLYPTAVEVSGPGQCNAEERGFINPGQLATTGPTGTPRNNRRATEAPSTAPRRKRAIEMNQCGAGGIYKANCSSFQCKISGLAPRDKVDIRVVSRLYVYSLQQDEVFDLNLTSSAVIQFETLPSPVQIMGGLDKNILVTTDVVNTQTTVTTEEREPWVIPVVVVASILFLALVIGLMVGLGFFKRPTKDKLEEKKEEMERLNAPESQTIEVNGEGDVGGSEA